MNVIKTELEGLLIIEPRIFEDKRGYFFESYQKERYIKSGIPCTFVQDNESRSEKGVVRGLHYQEEPYAQSKLVRVIYGEVLDVAVDIRKNSKTYGKWFSLKLSAENKKQLFIPHGFAHGFSVLSDQAVLTYKCDNYYNWEAERGIIYNDPTLNIDWKVPEEEMIISEKDKIFMTLKEVEVTLKAE